MYSETVIDHFRSPRNSGPVGGFIGRSTGGRRCHDRPRPGPSVQIKALVAEESLLRGSDLRGWLYEHEQSRWRLLSLLQAGGQLLSLLQEWERAAPEAATR